MPSQAKPNVNTVWASAGLATPVDVAKQALGFVAEIPEYDDFNGMIQQISAFQKHVNQEGMPAWDSQTQYYTNGFTKANGTAYIALQDSLNNAPPALGATNAYWRDLFARVKDFAADTGAVNAYVGVYAPVLTLANGLTVGLKAANANTGASTFNGLPLVGLNHAALQGGEIVANGILALRYNSSLGGGSWILVSSSGGALQVAPASKSQHAVQLGQVSGVVGSTRNFVMNIAAASASATATADEVIVESALGGLRYCLTGFNKNINLAITGVGGMDTGAAPASGSVAIYAIYNPTTGVSGLLAVNASGGVAPEICAGVMPAGFTASALVSARMTSPSGQFTVGTQLDRAIACPAQTVFNNTPTNVTVTALGLSPLPWNAKRISGNMTIAASSASALSVAVYASLAGTGQLINNSNVLGGGQNVSSFSKLIVSTPRVAYMTSGIISGTGQNYVIAITEYEF